MSYLRSRLMALVCSAALPVALGCSPAPTKPKHSGDQGGTSGSDMSNPSATSGSTGSTGFGGTSGGNGGSTGAGTAGSTGSTGEKKDAAAGSNNGGSNGGGGNGGGGTTGGGMDAGGKDSGPARDGGRPDLPPAPTFTELYMTIFGVPFAASKSSCADGGGATCHNPSTHGGVTFKDKATAYMNLKAKVNTANPESSALYQRLTSTQVARRMPLNRPALAPDVIAKVLAWIYAGAPND